MRLITQRSQVQILSPLPTLAQVRGPFALRSGRAFGVVVNGWSTSLAPGRGRTGPNSSGGSPPLKLPRSIAETLGPFPRLCVGGDCAALMRVHFFEHQLLCDSRVKGAPNSPQRGRNQPHWAEPPNHWSRAAAGVSCPNRCQSLPVDTAFRASLGGRKGNRGGFGMASAPES